MDQQADRWAYLRDVLNKISRGRKTESGKNAMRVIELETDSSISGPAKKEGPFSLKRKEKRETYERQKEKWMFEMQGMN